MKPIKQFKVKIKGRTWTIAGWTYKNYDKVDHRSYALCDHDNYRIDFNLEFLTPGIVAHELTHAYADHMVTMRGQYIQPLAVEESMCATIQDNWDEFIPTHAKICKELGVKGKRVFSVV